MEDFDIGDYNDPPVSPSGTSQSGGNSGDGGPANGGPEEMSRDSDEHVRTPSAVESLMAIQAEMIPGYNREGSGRVEQPTASQQQSDPLLLFPGLATRSTHEEEEDSDV